MSIRSLIGWFAIVGTVTFVADAARASPFWGPSGPGPYRVGVRTDTIQVDAVGVQAVVWYPARAGGTQTTLSELLRMTCGPEGQPAVPVGPDACQTRLRAGLAEYRPSRTVSDEVFDWSTGGVLNAAPTESRYPLIVFDGGLRSDALSYFALAAWLASHGLVALSVPSVPARPGDQLLFDANGIRRKAAIVSAAIAAARRWPNVDPDRVVTAGWSAGGVSAAVAALEDRTVRGVLSLDGGLGYDYGGPLLRQVLPSSAPSSPPLLHITGMRPNPYPVPKDTAALTDMSSRTWQLALTGINHSHFVIQGGAVAFAGDRSPEATEFWDAFEVMASAARDFVRWATTAGPADVALSLASRPNDEFRRLPTP